MVSVYCLCTSGVPFKDHERELGEEKCTAWSCLPQCFLERIGMYASSEEDLVSFFSDTCPKKLKKKSHRALISVSQLVGVSSHNRKPEGLIPSQGTYLCFRFKPWSRCVRFLVWVLTAQVGIQEVTMFLSYIEVSIPPFLSL